MSKYHVPIDGKYNSANALLTLESLSDFITYNNPAKNDFIKISSLINYEKPINTTLYLTKEEAVQLANALHSLVVEIDREESKKDD